VLSVHFDDGSVYDYAKVPRAMFDRLSASAPTTGAFFNQSIRGKFTFKRVTAPTKPPTPSGRRRRQARAQPPAVRCPAQMTRRNVVSAVLDGVAYDPATRCLMLYFDSGHVYRYGNVPAAEYESLLRPGTEPGTYFNASIRNKYPSQRVAGPRGRR
jgi:hypothetical protein